MAKKNFFIKPEDASSKRKALEHFNNDDSKILGDDILGGWRELSSKKENDLDEIEVSPDE